MNIKPKHIVIAVAVLIVGAFLYTMWPSTQKDLLSGVSGSGSQADACTASTSVVTVLSSASTQILGTSTNRAYARIQQPLNATNTIALALNNAPVTNAIPIISLENASTTVGQTRYEFGLATPFPYTGAIAASSSNGTAVLQVIQCLY